MISKKAKEYEKKQEEEFDERVYMKRYNKCPHCLGKVKLEEKKLYLNYICVSCGLKR